ncbi:mycothiol synthase [Nocardia africana]|uniref:Mycothiol acetyltransferase n=1 Tax=Nocardia africana TaxID=134964 RepID=A0A378WLY8_9NOCA|nr:mycothiol synthase [Nocardia africana]MCC3316067.1 mycothiol synthase [Nocardia africana]SUA41595.1 Mycothiol acetyltransferase [Nocardia africana]
MGVSVQVPDWTTELAPATAARIVELVERAGAADAVAPISEQAVLSVTAFAPAGAPAAAEHDRADSDARARHLVVERDGELVAYANLVPAHGDHPAMAEAVVDPRARGRGIGATLVAAALQAGGPGARIWAHGNLAPARAVAGRLGLTIARELWQMRRALTEASDSDQATIELPQLEVPADIVLRTYAGPADDAEILRVNNAAFDWHPEQGGWTEAEIAVRRAAPWFDPKGLFIAADPADPARILGFHWTKVHEPDETSDAVGEVYVVAIDPAAQGRGLGRVLTLAGLHYLRERGLGAVILYTEADNTAAVHTYTRLGFETAHIDAAYTAR